MINFFKELFSPDPLKKLLRERDVLYKRAVALQRNGDLRTYGEVMTRISELEEEYSRLAAEKEDNPL